MVQRKYNWNQLHVEFLLSGKLAVADFLRSKGMNPRSAWTLRKTSGWAAEREQIGSKAVGVTKKRVEAELANIDEKAKRDAITLYTSLFDLLSRSLRLRGMTRLQKQAEAKRVDEIMQQVLDGQLTWEAAQVTLREKKIELPASIDPFVFESVLRSVRLTLGLPTRITKGELDVRDKTIADLVEKLGKELDIADQQRTRSQVVKQSSLSERVVRAAQNVFDEFLFLLVIKFLRSNGNTICAPPWLVAKIVKACLFNSFLYLFGLRKLELDAHPRALRPEHGEVARAAVLREADVKLIVFQLVSRFDLVDPLNEAIRHANRLFRSFLRPVVSVRDFGDLLVLVKKAERHLVQYFLKRDPNVIAKFVGVHLDGNQGDKSVEQTDHVVEARRDFFSHDHCAVVVLGVAFALMIPIFDRPDNVALVRLA